MKKGFRKVISGLLAISMIVSLTAPTGAVVRADEIQDTEVQESGLREIGESEKEPVILKNDTESDITFISAVEKDELDKADYKNVIADNEVIKAEETVKFYSDFIQDKDYVIVIKCNGETYFINTLDYFATDLSKEVSIKYDKGYSIMYLTGTFADGKSFDTLEKEIAIFTEDKANTEEKTEEVTEEVVETTESTTEATVEEKVTEEVTEEKVEETEEKTEEVTEKATEEVTEEKTEEKTEEAAEEKTEAATEEVVTEIDASVLKYRLLVASDKENIFTDGYVISSYEGIYLVGYATEEERKAGFEYYSGKAIFVEYDDEIFEVADNESSQTDASEPEVVNQDDALTVLGELDESEVIDESKVIAVIDTGANIKVADAISVIGENTADDNGHGSDMIDAILAENPKAKILSIKAFDENGKAKPSDVYAAIRYAIDNNVTLINISASSISSKDSEIVEDIINEAIENNIIVVGSAGNKGADAKYFVPGKIDKAYIIGACTEDKVKVAESNYGDTVDYYVVADSTSKAAAIFSGKISKSGKLSLNDLKGVYLPKDVKIEGTDNDIDEEDTDFNINAYQREDDFLTLSNVPSICDGVVVNVSTDYNAASHPVFEYRTKSNAKKNQPVLCMDDGLRSGNSINNTGNGDSMGGGYMPVKSYSITNNKFKRFVYYLVVNYSGGNYTTTPTIGGSPLSYYVHKYFYDKQGGVVSGSGLNHSRCNGWATDSRVQEWDEYRKGLLGNGWDVPGDLYEAESTHLNGVSPTVDQNIYNAAIAYANINDPCPAAFTISELVNFSRGALYVNSGHAKTPSWEYQNYLTYSLNYKITIEKSSSVSDYKKSMDGIQYDLYNHEGKLVATFTLGENGKTKSISIYKGEGSIASADDAVYTDGGRVWLAWSSSLDSQSNWYFQEKGSNGNYAMDVLPHTVTVKREDNVLTSSDYPDYGMVQVFKTDEAGNPLSGCTFGIYTDKATAEKATLSNTDAKNKVTTSASGIANFVNRPNGTYYIKELSVPDGYVLDSTVRDATIKVNGSKTIYKNGQYYGYVFNSDDYISTTYNPGGDLKKAFGEDTFKLGNHFINHGMNEARRASVNFDFATYRATYADLRTAFGNDYAKYYQHYMNSGAREGRLSRPLSEYTNMSYGRHENETEVVIYKIKNIKKKDYYIAIKKTDDSNRSMKSVTFDLSFKDNDSNTTKTFNASYSGGTNGKYNGIYSGFDSSIVGEYLSYTENATDKGLSVIYLGKYVNAPTNITVKENWIEVSEGNWANGRAVLYEADGSSKNVYKRDYVTNNTRMTLTAYTSRNDAISNVGKFTFKNNEKHYYIGIHKVDAGDSSENIKASFKIYGTNTSGATSGGTEITALGVKDTNATTGLLSVDVTAYYNSNTSGANVSGKYKYFYAQETTTDNKHVISVQYKALPVNTTVTYTNWPNARKVYVQLVKTSATPECVKNNPNYTLDGTQFKVFKTRPEADAALASGDYSASIGNLNITAAKIDANGVGTSNELDVSDYMGVNPSTGKFRTTTFYAIETAVGKGYVKSNTSHEIRVTADNIYGNPAKLEVENTPLLDPVQIKVSKTDIDGSSSESGTGTLAGAQFTIKFYAVDTNTTYTASQLSTLKADASWTIETKYDAANNIYVAAFNDEWLVKNGSVTNSDFYYDSQHADPMIPAGYVTIQETKAPTGYTASNPVYKAQATGAALSAENGIIVANTKDMENLVVGNTVVDGNIILEEKPIRGDFELLKTDKEGKPMANVEFEIKSDTTGEKYTIKTGTDGKYNSKTAGLWFSKKKDGTETAKIDGMGALPTGTYTVTELRCAANKGYQLQPALKFTVSEAITYIVKDGKVTENAIYNVKNPEITTSASVTETGTKMAPQNSSVTIKDTVSYSNLKVDTDYVAVGRLMVVNEDNTSSVYKKNGSDYIVTKTFKTGADYTKSVYEATGTFDVEFTVDTKNLDGKKLVVFEKLYLGTTAPANDTAVSQYPGVADEIFPVVHENLDDNNQTIIVPKVETNAYKTGDTANKSVTAAPNASVTDTITYSNLDASLTYSVKSSLIDKATGNVVKDAATGADVTVTNNSFKPAASDGTHDVTFTWDATGMEGKTFVVFEEISYNNKVVASHTELNDVRQTVYLPSLKSQVKDDKTKDQITLADKNASITDTIEYSNLTPGTEYTVKGTMMDKAAKTALKDSSGNTVTVSVPFTPAAASGKQDVTFKFDASGLGGKTIVAFQDIYLGETIVASENDYEQVTQTISIPKGQTEALDSETGTRLSLADSEVTINDTVQYSNLLPGKTYKTTGKLINKETGEPLVINGKEVTNTVEFKADKADGEIVVPFTFDASALEGQTFVVFEDVYYNNVEVIIHHDINDIKQTPQFPKVRTTVSDDKTADHVTLAEKSASFTDVVSYENVLAGKKYKVEGTLMNKATKTALLDADGNEIKVTSDVFEADKTSGTVSVKFTFDASLLEGATIVVYEKLILVGEKEDVVAKHENIEDKEQTIYIPQAGTSVKDAKTKDHITLAETSARLIDTVSYKNLLAGKQYKISGKLYDKATGKPFIINGKEVTAEKTFTPDKPDGKEDVEFVFDASALEDKTVVVFEDIYLGEKLIAAHHDINDSEQTIYIPKGKTTVTDDKTKDKMTYAEEKASITDVLTYSNLIPGKKYSVVGTLMDKETNKPVTGKDGKEITNTVSLTPTEASGSINIPFTFDSSILKGQKIVVFEDVYYNDVPVIIHHDINDNEQTTRIPDGHTTVKDAATEDHITFASEQAEIIDTVTYENLIADGREYTVTGTLMDKATGKPVLQDGKEITNTAKFIPEKENGTVDVSFKFNSEVLKGQKIVVFEDVYYNDVLVFTHHDINDVDQTTTIPKGHTVVLDDKTKEHLTLAEKEATITDTVYYEGLIVGKEYTTTGTLYDKETEKPLLDEEGKEITSTVTFTAEETTGIIKVPFKFDALLLKGKQVVVFEDVYFDKKQVIVHHDITDEEQTTWIPDGHTTVKDAKTEDHITLAEEDAHIDDTVTYSNLIADGRTYTATGTLMDKATGAAILDAEGNTITNTVSFIPEKPDGEVVVPFTFDASLLKGQKIVVFENIQYSGKDVIIHHDINDVDQTTTIPGGSTQAKDTKTYTNMALAEPQTTIYDFVLYKGLIADGREYESKGVLMDKETGKPILDKDGKEITNTVKFKPESESGYVTVPFTFDSSLLKGKTVVVFEDVYWNNKEVFIHHDITDIPQTVVFPEVVTTATMKNAGKTVTAGDDVTVVDEVAITNILKDEEYIVRGKLYNKSTGKPFTVGGKELTAEKNFKAEDTKANVTAEFSFSTKGIDKIDLVVFEELYVVREINGKKTEVLVADHSDLNDKNQTVNIITVPKTGDTSPVLPIAGAGMVALIGAAAIMFYKKKNER